jgi:hypothetical protein
MPDVLKRYSEGTDEPRSRLILYWKLPPPSGSSCIGKKVLL